MDQLVQCPVCTLFLHNGMTLESHLDTHPKDQVIKALCSLTSNKVPSYGSRTPTPLHSDRSYRSRSHTPAAEENRWNGPRRSEERYWRRTPSRTPKANALSGPSRTVTPDVRMSEISFENNNGAASVGLLSSSQFMTKADKIQQTYQSPPISEFDPQYIYYDQHEDREIKYSRSAEYNSLSSPNGLFTYNNMVPPMPPAVKMVPAIPKRGNDLNKVLPKPNNILLKNMAGVQYIGTGPKPMHVMVPSTSTFVQKNVHNNMIMTGSVPSLQMQIDNKSGMGPQPNSQINQMTSGGLTSGTTVVTQNSQIVYREVNSSDGKPFVTRVPTVLGAHDTVTNLTQAGSLYQNVMVVDQYGNTSCMYPTPHQVLPKPPTYNEPPVLNNTLVEPRKSPESVNDPKTLIIEVSPIAPPVQENICEQSSSSGSQSKAQSPVENPKTGKENSELKCESPVVTKGLKILSNIKVEVPVQHHKNMVNTVMDLTGPNDSDYPVEQVPSPEKILPDLDDNVNNEMSNDCMPQSRCGGDSPNSSFSSLKGKTLSKDFNKRIEDSKMDGDFSDSCPVPDLICNEKPSISPCSELSENGDNSTDRTSISPKLQDRSSLSPKLQNLGSLSPKLQNRSSISPKLQKVSSISPKLQNLSSISTKLLDYRSISPKLQDHIAISPKQINNSKIDISEKTVQFPHKAGKQNVLRLNNIYVKKHKKVLQIKNSKNSTSSISSNIKTTEPVATSSSSKSPENFTMNKLHQTDKSDNKEKSSVLQTISVEEIKENEDNNEFDADTEEQSMDIEPVAPSTMNQQSQFTATVELQCVHVKEEINTSNEGGFSNHTATSDRDLVPMESLRPINVVPYANMSGAFEDDSNDRELLDLETASKNKQFVSMMNENYFGDNIYADYFTPDRVESFEAEREAAGFKDGPKDGMYNIWGEPSQKENENEFVLPNFIHESYKIAESSGMDYSEIGTEGQGDGEVDGSERESKADVLSEGRSESEVPLNICADERMPPRGELSGQESNGDMESPWGGMYTDVPATEPYDLIARESWVSDGSDVDVTEKRETLEEELQYPKSLPRVYPCTLCSLKATSLKELRAHKALVHSVPVSPTCTETKHSSKPAPNTYSRLVSDRKIKKEEKTHEANALTNNLLSIDSKKPITPSILQVYDSLEEAKPKLEGLIKIKQETKRRRRDYICPTCKVDQGSDAAFNAHLKIHPLECLTCGKCFFRRANLALHMKMHLGIRNFKCEVCEKRFITRQKLMEHNNVHTGRQPVKCTICDDTFRRYSNMVQHRDRHHLQKRIKVRDFVCPCGAVFHSRAKLLWHKETHDDKPKSCLYCSDKFVHASSLTRHVRRTHNEFFLSDKNKNKAENVTCPVCKQVYLRANLRAHLSTHSGARPYPCVVCNKSFTTKWNLKLHRWTHMSRSAKPYKCSLCASAFHRHTEFISHMNAHKCVRPYTCNYCGCQFIRKYNCQRHVREHETGKKFVCKVPECGKSFHRSYYLSEHMKVHSGARPFSCSICGKTSSNKSNHNKHIKIHHAREPVATEA